MPNKGLRSPLGLNPKAKLWLEAQGIGFHLGLGIRVSLWFKVCPGMGVSLGFRDQASLGFKVSLWGWGFKV